MSNKKPSTTSTDPVIMSTTEPMQPATDPVTEPIQPATDQHAEPMPAVDPITEPAQPVIKKTRKRRTTKSKTVSKKSTVKTKQPKDSNLEAAKAAYAAIKQNFSNQISIIESNDKTINALCNDIATITTKPIFNTPTIKHNSTAEDYYNAITDLTKSYSNYLANTIKLQLDLIGQLQNYSNTKKIYNV